MTLTQLTLSSTKKSCSWPVRGEIFTSERSLKMRKSPMGVERMVFQGLIIYDL